MLEVSFAHLSGMREDYHLTHSGEPGMLPLPRADSMDVTVLHSHIAFCSESVDYILFFLS